MPGEHELGVKLNLYTKYYGYIRSDEELNIRVKTEAGRTYEVSSRLFWGKRWRPVVTDLATGNFVHQTNSSQSEKKYESEEMLSENIYVVRIPYETKLDLISVGKMLERAATLCKKLGYSKVAAIPYISNRATHEIKSGCVNSSVDLPDDLKPHRTINIDDYLSKEPRNRAYPLSLIPPV